MVLLCHQFSRPVHILLIFNQIIFIQDLKIQQELAYKMQLLNYKMEIIVFDFQAG